MVMNAYWVYLEVREAIKCCYGFTVVLSKDLSRFNPNLPHLWWEHYLEMESLQMSAN
jgi:hypothetical protein